MFRYVLLAFLLLGFSSSAFSTTKEGELDSVHTDTELFLEYKSCYEIPLLGTNMISVHVVVYKSGLGGWIPEYEQYLSSSVLEGVLNDINLVAVEEGSTATLRLRDRFIYIPSGSYMPDSRDIYEIANRVTYMVRWWVSLKSENTDWVRDVSIFVESNTQCPE